MTRGSYQVLVSRWAVSELWWLAEGAWLWVFDRPLGRLSDAEVLAKYGDEAFRRRDELLETGEASYRPDISELIGRRIVAAVAGSGWDVVSDDWQVFRARLGGEEIEVYPRQGRHPRLEVVTPAGRRIVESLALAESLVLGAVTDGRRMPRTDEIMSWNTEDAEERWMTGTFAASRDVRAERAYFDEMVEHLTSIIEFDEKLLQRPAEQWRTPESLALAAEDAVKHRWVRFSALYSAGASEARLRDDFDDILAAAERATRLEKQHFPPDLIQLHFRNPKVKDHYLAWLRLVSLAVAFETDEATFDRVVSAVEFGWGDRLIDGLIATRKPDRVVGEELLFPRSVGPLADALSDEAEAVEDVARYLAKWYTAWKGIWGWSEHELVPKKRYHGYWAFEALGVVGALRLDDSSFRENEYYPRDLAAPALS